LARRGNRLFSPNETFPTFQSSPGDFFRSPIPAAQGPSVPANFPRTFRPSRYPGTAAYSRNGSVDGPEHRTALNRREGRWVRLGYKVSTSRPVSRVFGRTLFIRFFVLKRYSPSVRPYKPVFKHARTGWSLFAYTGRRNESGARSPISSYVKRAGINRDRLPERSSVFYVYRIYG